MEPRFCGFLWSHVVPLKLCGGPDDRGLPLISSCDIIMMSDATTGVQILKRNNMGQIWSESKYKAYG